MPTGPTNVAFFTSGVITGGSGRFSGATGRADFSGTADIQSLMLSGGFQGSISLP